MADPYQQGPLVMQPADCIPAANRCFDSAQELFDAATGDEPASILKSALATAEMLRDYCKTELLEHARRKDRERATAQPRPAHGGLFPSGDIARMRQEYPDPG